MPEAMERKLKMEAMKKKMSKKRMGAYVYGTMRKAGWKPEGEKDDMKLRHTAMKLKALKRKS